MTNWIFSLGNLERPDDVGSPPLEIFILTPHSYKSLALRPSGPSRTPASAITHKARGQTERTRERRVKRSLPKKKSCGVSPPRRRVVGEATPTPTPGAPAMAVAEVRRRRRRRPLRRLRRSRCCRRCPHRRPSWTRTPAMRLGLLNRVSCSSPPPPPPISCVVFGNTPRIEVFFSGDLCVNELVGTGGVFLVAMRGLLSFPNARLGCSCGEILVGSSPAGSSGDGFFGVYWVVSLN